MEIHLDPLGGIAGDMFIAAVLDAFPEQADAVLEAIELVLAGGAQCRLLRHADEVLSGARFSVEATEHRHSHTSWASIRERLSNSSLSSEVARHALGIFGLLAEAEARVHGVEAEAVTFHEIGAWDSIADIVGAAQLIAALGPSRWSVAALPLGSGRVRTAHGPLPVPTPATALLLQGFATIDDGVPGERVTPTGAAIVRYLCEPDRKTPRPRILGRTGIGFGTKSMPGISNCLRVLAFDEATPLLAAAHRQITVIEFEVDDQSAEDLGLGLERLRAGDGVLDVVQTPVFGKKGRVMTHIRILAKPSLLDEVTAACFRETTTIGLRYRDVDGIALPRRIEEIEIDGRTVRVKTVTRPDGRTAKAEADDAASHIGHAARARLRRLAEQQALAKEEK